MSTTTATAGILRTGRRTAPDTSLFDRATSSSTAARSALQQRNLFAFSQTMDGARVS